MKATKKQQHTATKITAGEYLYRGYTIRRFDYASLNDAEGQVEWNIYAPGEENMSDSEASLKMAKHIVNARLNS